MALRIVIEAAHEAHTRSRESVSLDSVTNVALQILGAVLNSNSSLWPVKLPAALSVIHHQSLTAACAVLKHGCQDTAAEVPQSPGMELPHH